MSHANDDDSDEEKAANPDGEGESVSEQPTAGPRKRQRPKRFRPELFGMTTDTSPIIGDKPPAGQQKKIAERIRQITGQLNRKDLDAKTRKHLEKERWALMRQISAPFAADFESEAIRTETIRKDQGSLIDRIFACALTHSILTPEDVAVLRVFLTQKSRRKKGRDLAASKSNVKNLEKRALSKLNRNWRRLLELLRKDPDMPDDAAEALWDLEDPGGLLDTQPEPELSQEDSEELHRRPDDQHEDD
jgi:hypothetical protein